jgi:hypothetical protein
MVKRWLDFCRQQGSYPDITRFDVIWIEFKNNTNFAEKPE